MKRLRFLVLILISGVISGCIVDNNEKLLSLAERCLEEYPDSASQLLDRIGDLSELSDNQMAKFSLIRVQTNHKMKRTLVNDSLINLAVDYFCRENEKHMAAKSLLYKGLVHKQRKEVEKAAESFALSEQWFEGVEDDQYKALLYNHYGALMMGEKNYEDALRYLKRAFFYEEKGDSLHYLSSTCGAIANVFVKLGDIDSAQVYFEKGLQYKHNMTSRGYYLYIKGYANFLRRNGDLSGAERMLKECEQQIEDEQRFSVYSSLATLYYETGDYEKALAYAEKMQESRDSLMMRGCCLHLYRIHARLGHKDMAHDYYKRYTDIHDDMQARMKTKEVAVIPHRVEKQMLAEKNRRGEVLRGWLLNVIVVLVVISLVVYWVQRSRHRRKHEDMQGELSDKNIRIGQLKSVISNKDNKIERIERKQEADNNRYRETIKIQKEQIDCLEEERKMQKHTAREQEKDLKKFTQLQQEWEVLNEEVNEEQRFKQHLQACEGADMVNAMLYLRYGKSAGHPVSEPECEDCLYKLLLDTDEALCTRIESTVKSPAKRIICYLLGLGYKDMDMFARAVSFVTPATLRKYYRECKEMMKGGRGCASRF